MERPLVNPASVLHFATIWCLRGQARRWEAEKRRATTHLKVPEMPTREDSGLWNGHVRKGDRWAPGKLFYWFVVLP